MSNGKSNSQYEVLSPWAEADPIPIKGIAPRLTDLSGKKIGILCNIKRAAPPILGVVERELKKKYPTSEVSWFRSQSMSVSELEPQNREKFDKWIEGIDAAILAVGD
jgi:hypothetical protein